MKNFRNLWHACSIQVFLAAAKLLPKLLIILKIFVSDHNSEILLCFLALFFYILKITSILLKPKIWHSIISDRKHIVPYSWRRKWQPTPVFLPGEFHGQRSLERFSPWGRKKSDMTEQLTHTYTIVLCRILSAMQGNRHVNCGMCRGRDRVIYHYCKYIFFFLLFWLSKQNRDLSTIMMPIWGMRKLRHSEVR